MTYTELLLKSNLKLHYRLESCYIHKLFTLLKNMRIKLGNGKGNNEFN